MFDRILNTPLKKTPSTPIYLFMDGVQLPQARATSGGGGSLLFTHKFPEIPGTHFIDLGRMKDWADLELPGGFEHKTPGFGIQRINH